MTRAATLSAATLVLLAPLPVISAEYLTVQQALRVAYPDATRFDDLQPQLSAEQLARIAARAGPQPQHGRLQAFRAFRGDVALGHLLVDEVLGRERLITYAVTLDPQGVLGTPDVLAYRENHGQGVRFEYWRRQFRGKSSLEQLNFRTDIKSIAGGTISAEHVTQGLRWLLAYYQLCLMPAPP